eukprot:TRINITY_DN15767_c0_g1_i1.p1 TRINITY_DN15767_c0_g1~~TRINITY_DN15767_c0_g1_i1.p1  ORF type:complete len:158 (-),score=39.67 TRINITY_DN15767_c0_g1_i1:13-486(-)
MSTLKESTQKSAKPNKKELDGLKGVYEEAFSLFDKNGSGQIEAEELRHVFHAVHHDISEQQLEIMMKRFDKDGNGLISFEEFVTLMSKADVEPDDLRSAVRELDPGSTGVVDKDEFSHVLTTMGDKLSPDEVKELLEALNISGQNIDISDLVSVLLS